MCFEMRELNHTEHVRCSWTRFRNWPRTLPTLPTSWFTLPLVILDIWLVLLTTSENWDDIFLALSIRTAGPCPSEVSRYSSVQIPSLHMWNYDGVCCVHHLTFYPTHFQVIFYGPAALWFLQLFFFFFNESNQLQVSRKRKACLSWS